MAFRKAGAIVRLQYELDKLAPKRSKVSDGWIGDAAHATRTSDHNPWVKDSKGVGVVRGVDITHDPAGGVDGNRLAAWIASQLGKHPALGRGAYVIWNHRIISTDRLGEGWRRYDGSNPHTKHVHVSFGLSGYDSSKTFSIKKGLADKVMKRVSGKWPVYLHVTKQQAKSKNPSSRHTTRRIQKMLVRVTGAALATDGIWGPATAKAYKRFQASRGFRTNRGIGSGSLRTLVKEYNKLLGSKSKNQYLYLP